MTDLSNGDDTACSSDSMEHGGSAILAVGDHVWLKDALATEGFDAALLAGFQTRIPGAQHVLGGLGTAVKACTEARKHQAVLVCTDFKMALVAAVVGMMCASRRVPLVALNLILYPKPGVRGLLRDYIYRAICERAALAISVNSEWLRQTYMSKYHFSFERIHLLSDCWLPVWKRHYTPPNELDGGYVFSGGTASRDWRTVIEAARRCPTIPFRLVARRADWPTSPDLPENLQVAFDTPLDEFWDTAKNARVCVVSLATNITSGLVVLILTLLMGRPVICTRTPATEFYYPREVSEFLVEPGDAGAIVRCIESLWGDHERRLDIARTMQEYVMTTHSPESYAARLGEIIRAHASTSCNPGSNASARPLPAVDVVR
jgi:hypothetical protein